MNPESSTRHAAAGKRLSGAEYCAPLLEFHGHIQSLADRVDFIFYPQLLENARSTEEDYYCYYSRFAIPLVRNIPGFSVNEQLFTPVINMRDDPDSLARSLYLGFPDALKERVAFAEVDEALRLSLEWYRERKADRSGILAPYLHYLSRQDSDV